jgi:hypothetical protein
MVTFKHVMPLRSFMENGGDFMKSRISLTSTLNNDTYAVVKREGSTLELENNIGIRSNAHVENCWVVVEVIAKR